MTPSAHSIPAFGNADQQAFRARVIDDQIKFAAREWQIDTVLNSSAVRFQRVALPTDIHWIDCDLAPSVALRRLPDSSHRALVLTEGMLMCFSPAQVRILGTELHACERVVCWLTDLSSENAPDVAFAPADPQAFFFPLGWQPIRFRSFFLESNRLHRLLNRVAPTLRETWRRNYGVMILRRATFPSEAN